MVDQHYMIDDIEMLNNHSFLTPITEQVKHHLIELLAWLEEPHSDGVINVIIEDSDYIITLLNQLKIELRNQYSSNSLVV